jgi:O-antigen/teichoic acid export membrane protein
LIIILNQNTILHFIKLGKTQGKILSSLLPGTMVMFLLSTLSGVFLSSLEGFQKLYLKNLILIFSSVLTLFLAFFLVPRFNLNGIAYTYVISNIFIYIFSWYFLRKNLGGSLKFLPFGWSRLIFKQTFSYNAKFQIIALSAILNDPLIRIIMVRYTGLQIAGVYELSSKIILQMRALIISSTQSLVPFFAGLGKERKAEALDFYQKAYEVLFFIGLFSFSTLAISSPLISLFWIGSINSTFVWFMVIRFIRIRPYSSWNLIRSKACCMDIVLLIRQKQKHLIYPSVLLSRLSDLRFSRRMSICIY